jgi:hypothetical protein
MSVAYLASLALATACSGVAIAYALHAIDGGSQARELKTVFAAKSERLVRTNRSAAVYVTLQSPSAGGSTLRRIAVENARDVSRAKL